MIEPYIGYNGWETDPLTGKAKTLHAMDGDNTGSKTYAFNSHGFRGEEFDPYAKKRIFFSGCSYTFGTGLDYEETTAHQFKLQYCGETGIDPAGVNLLNFAMPGASNDYIARTLIAQCRKIKPDMAIAIFTHANRAEYINEEELGERVWTVGPWWVNEQEEAGPPEAAERMELIREAATGYFYYTTSANSAARFLHNALLLQYYFRENNIPYLFHCVETGLLDYAQQHFALKALSELLDKRQFINYSNAGIYRCDLAADGAHPGPQSNRHIASELFNTGKLLYGF